MRNDVAAKYGYPAAIYGTAYGELTFQPHHAARRLFLPHIEKVYPNPTAAHAAITFIISCLYFHNAKNAATDINA